MTAANTIAATDETPIFSALITPHRSLGRFGFHLLIGLFGLVSFIAGLVFWIAGAWPVIGFFGLDVLLLYGAFRLNYRAAGAFEEVIVTAGELRVRNVTPRGRVREWRLNPLWVRLEKIEDEDFGVTQLLLVSRGQQLPVAQFLGPREKANFAKALTAALGEARRGPTRTVV
jgi:uncharacterized membrane protein